MTSRIEPVPSGTVTSPQGFFAGATSAGIKKAKDALDLAVLFSEVPAAAAGMFTTNRVKAAPVLLCQKRLTRGRASVVVVNSGCANACTGDEGLHDAEETTELAACSLGVPADDALVASTGVIGVRLPMDKIRRGLGDIALARIAGHDLAQAIMTTDTHPKEIALDVEVDGARFVVGGVAKGAGMIHPDMATLLSFLTTDAAVELEFLKSALRKTVEASFNMLSVDGDTSTNDTVLIMANGLAGNEPIKAGTSAAVAFGQALEIACVHLAKAIALDGEGATKLIEITVEGAPDLASARQVARTIATSPLVKAAIHGNDPNWGRVVAAAGRSGVPVVEEKMDLLMGGTSVLKGGRPVPFDKPALAKALDAGEVSLILSLNTGDARATAWGCDLSEEYVTLNSQYTT